MTSRLFPAALALFLVLPAAAQEAAPAAGLALELNALQQGESGCRVTFLATNRLGALLERAGVEVALFDTSGAIERIVNLDFKALSENKTKVLQFELAGLDCGDLGRVLVNDIPACEGPGLDAGACLAGLSTSARPDIEFGT
ncbi:hypothetical protein [Devosia nitrariae]|uniref:Tat pathway signal sequence domain protein n=1 Tax=Devosia nitrariae TaxID=2071872 RepID=A0ABQ5W3K6_9HYPH|nr:hypothetical protein [Devosia nitrariae]GLQ54647.1 hypothetical protein GCM10010862_19060 [Devosia nitrariae]